MKTLLIIAGLTLSGLYFLKEFAERVGQIESMSTKQLKDTETRGRR